MPYTPAVQIAFSSSVSHDNIVRLLDVFAEGQQLVIVVRGPWGRGSCTSCVWTWGGISELHGHEQIRQLRMCPGPHANLHIIKRNVHRRVRTDLCTVVATHPNMAGRSNTSYLVCPALPSPLRPLPWKLISRPDLHTRCTRHIDSPTLPLWLPTCPPALTPPPLQWELISGPDLLDLLNECGGCMPEDMAAFYFTQAVGTAHSISCVCCSALHACVTM